MKQDMPGSVSLHPFTFLLSFSLKLINFHLIKSLMKPDTFDSKKLNHTSRQFQSKPITPTTIT